MRNFNNACASGGKRPRKQHPNAHQIYEEDRMQGRTKKQMLGRKAEKAGKECAGGSDLSSGSSSSSSSSSSLSSRSHSRSRSQRRRKHRSMFALDRFVKGEKNLKRVI